MEYQDTPQDIINDVIFSSHAILNSEGTDEDAFTVLKEALDIAAEWDETSYPNEEQYKVYTTIADASPAAGHLCTLSEDFFSSKESLLFLAEKYAQIQNPFELAAPDCAPV